MNNKNKTNQFDSPMVFCGYGLLFLTFAFYFYITNNYKFAFVFLGASFGIISFYLLKIKNGYLIYVMVILSTLFSFSVYHKLLEYQLNKIAKINEYSIIGKIHITHRRGEISTAEFIGKNHSVVLNY